MTPINVAKAVYGLGEVSAVGATKKALVWDRPADLVIISGPRGDQNMLNAVLDSAQKKGLIIKLIGNGEDSLDLKEIAECRQSGALGPATQVFVTAHGGRINERHTIEYDSAKEPISSAEFMHLLRGTHPDGATDASQTKESVWKGTVHLMSCKSGKMRDEIRNDEALRQSGDYALHSSGKDVYFDSMLCNALSIVDYLEECKRERAVPDLYAMGRWLMEVTGESFTLAEPKMVKPLIVHAPKTPQHTEASYLTVNKNSGEKPTITGDEKDVHRLLLNRPGEKPLTPTRELEKAFNTFCVRLGRKKFDEAAALLDKFPELAKGIKGRISPIILSLVNFHVPILSKLLLGGANIHERDKFGNTALAYACEIGNKDAVEFLINNGAAKYDRFGESNLSIFHLAVSSNNADLVRYLVGLPEASHFIDCQNKDDETALHLAATYGNTEMIRVLTDFHADVTLEDSIGRRALHNAVQSGDLKAIQLLISADANVADFKDDDGITPLHLAAELGHREALQILIDADADLSAQDDFGNNVLHYAVASGNLDAVGLLADLLARQPGLNLQDIHGNTPLHLAASTGNLEMVKIFLKAESEVNIENEDGYTPKEIARLTSHPNVVQALSEPPKRKRRKKANN